MSASFAGFGSIKTNSKNDSARLDEVVEMIKWVDKKYVLVRVLDRPPLQVRQAWIKLYAGKERKEVTIPRYVVNFDPSNPEKPKKGVRCPYSELATGEKDASVRVSDFWLFNVIDREMQEDGPPRKAKGPTKEEKKTGFKDINSETWTPVKAARFTSTMIQRIAELSAENKKKDKKTGKVGQYDATHPKFGFDLKVKFKKDAPGTDKYSIDKEDGGATPLTKEEQEYLVWDLSEKLLDATGRETEEQALQSVKRMTIVGMEVPDDDDDEDSGKKKKKKGKSRSLDDDDDEDEDDKPKKSKKGKKPFDDDDDDDDDEDEDEKPKKGKKSSKSKEKVKDKKSSKKSKKDDDDDDDDEDEKPKKSKKTDKAKSSKSKEKVKEKSSKKKSKKDDDDEKPKKKKASKEKAGKSSKDKPSKKKGKKSNSWDDD